MWCLKSHPIYFLNASYCEQFIHSFVYYEPVIFNQNVITLPSDEMRLFSPKYYAWFVQSFHLLKPDPFLKLSSMIQPSMDRTKIDATFFFFTIKSYTDDGFLQANTEVNINLVPSIKPQKISSVTSKLLTCFIHNDSLHKLLQLLWILKHKYNRQKNKIKNVGYKWTTPWSHDFKHHHHNSNNVKQFCIYLIICNLFT